MTAVHVQGLSKRYGDTIAVDAVDLTIESGEMFFLLGPSGCGKTTLLRLIAGFLEPTAGRIRFDERDVTNVPANRRNVGMVFQSYALWPHMTVFDNVAFGLKVRRTRAGKRESRVMEALRLVQMAELSHRKPNQLSGGQQQRVALARALAINPQLLLLDEPLSNLDARLRLEMRSHIRIIAEQTRTTMIYVTHDQKEALSMADRIAVMRTGRVVQVGSPRELYTRPRSRFVADFLGETNFLPATIAGVEQDGALALETPAGVLFSTAFENGSPPSPGQAVVCSIRPESFRLTATAGERNVLTGSSKATTFLGESAQHTIELAGGACVQVTELHPKPRAMKGPISVKVEASDVVVLSWHDGA